MLRATNLVCCHWEILLSACECGELQWIVGQKKMHLNSVQCAFSSIRAYWWHHSCSRGFFDILLSEEIRFYGFCCIFTSAKDSSVCGKLLIWPMLSGKMQSTCIWSKWVLFWMLLQIELCWNSFQCHGCATVSWFFFFFFCKPQLFTDFYLIALTNSLPFFFVAGSRCFLFAWWLLDN